ncbi:Dual specificity protein phosphatase [Entamoeba marina]
MRQVGQGIDASKKKLNDSKFMKYISRYTQQNKINPIQVKTFVVTYNSLTYIPPLNMFTGLGSLDLSHNKIETIGTTISSVNTLTSLKISYNKLTDITNLCLMKNLKILNVSHNSITSLPIDQFTNLSGLSEFDISWNCLKEFDYDWLIPLKSIHFFSVVANHITSITNDNLKYSKEFGTPYSQLQPNNIIPYLYLGSVESTTKPFLRKNNISAVLSLGIKPLYTSKKIQYKFIQITDTINDDISIYFEETFNFIEENISSEKNVLVHCVAGVSRSASLVISYIMKKQKLSYNEAFEIVKVQRNCVCPNASFKEQLIKYKFK